jgi:glycosyltransferase involved in cell wall biosynthesis
MKVVIVSFMLHPNMGGGAAASAFRLARGLAQRQIDVVVITTHAERRITVSEEEGIKIYRFRPQNLYWVGDKDNYQGLQKIVWQLIDTWNPQVYATVRDILQHEKPDVVHVQKLRGLSPAVWSAAKAAECRLLIQTCRDYELMSPEGTLTSRIGRWAEKGEWFIRPYQWIRSRASAVIDVATAPSRYTLTTLTERGFFPRARQIVIPNTHGYSLEWLTRYEAPAASESTWVTHPQKKKLRLLYLGRLEKTKGVDLLCTAFLNIAEELPGLHLDIAGWGPLEDEVRHLVAGHSQIRLHGAVFGATKEELLRQCDMMVVPSVWPEVFGNVIVEAYAFGKPVIATHAGGIPELVQEGKTGFLVRAGDTASLQQAICRAAEYPTTIAHMSYACLETAKHYSLETITERYLQAYYFP